MAAKLQKIKRQVMSKIERRWIKLHKFEWKQKKLFLGKLTLDKGLRILSDLNQFAQELDVKASCKRLDEGRIRTLAKVHSMFQKVNL